LGGGFRTARSSCAFISLDPPCKSSIEQRGMSIDKDQEGNRDLTRKLRQDREIASCLQDAFGKKILLLLLNQH